ncbi:unnamed protein product, partial [Notodromas monacha]
NSEVESGKDKVEEILAVNGSRRRKQNIFHKHLKNVDGDSAAKRLSIELKPWDHFCFHDRFTFGDSIDVYFHFAPETYSRQLFYEFYVVEQYAGEYQTLLGLANALNNASISAVDEGNRQKLRDSTLKLVRQKLRNCELMLRQMRDVEEASRSQAEENFTLVNSWSCFQVIP